MSSMVDTVVASMTSHHPEAIPLASTYRATENSHPAALGMMAAWRTISKASRPSLVALDAEAGSAYFASTVEEAGSPSVLWGRIKVVDRKVAEVEIFINRARGDHGFSFSPEQLPANYHAIMAPASSRTRTTRAELMALARASFDASDPLKIAIAEDCQFTEVGWQVVDPGLDDVAAPPPPGSKPGEKVDPNRPLGCMFPPFRPTDKNARIIAVDDELGIVVTAAVISGVVYPYPYFGHMLSAFIPSDMKEPAKMQDAWIQRHVSQGKAPIVQPEPASGEVFQVFQMYDGKMHASQINVYLSGPGSYSVWVKR